MRTKPSVITVYLFGQLRRKQRMRHIAWPNSPDIYGRAWEHNSLYLNFLKTQITLIKELVLSSNLAKKKAIKISIWLFGDKTIYNPNEQDLQYLTRRLNLNLTNHKTRLDLNSFNFISWNHPQTHKMHGDLK